MSAHRKITTLKDIFPEIRREYKRNFLLENKIKIRDLQKDIKTRKQKEIEQQEETEKRRHKIHERLTRSTTRTSNSTPMSNMSNVNSVRRSKSNHSRSTKIHTECTCGSKLKSPPTSAKSTTSIDKEVQTDYYPEDINFKPKESPKEFPISIENNDQNDVDSDELKDINVEENLIDPEKHIELDGIEIDSGRSFQRMMNGRDQRLESASNPFLCKDKVDYTKPYHEVPNSANWNEKFNQLKLDDEISVKSSAIGKKKSARSIMSSTNTGRSDLKLPKYLEKEKREKELQRIKEMERDPDCPEGYTLLDEKTRLENLEVLQKGFQYLVNELNRLPMTSVTLRVKNRKNEIERDLVDLENKIRFYQKSKIYIKCPQTADA
ncbi:uncharacterized protein LOC129619279 [Condylostylus longicornis]|uniref:uncharacterized protein LOC129619279 n=1 Tax=Condylostylus longicornis TaxID=2530218 RepID=UPI00244E37ED|nr:uncharacterized protein LOC129619279 [Condylostylus longicornis]